ncbi:hypothetical protein SpCBS45565_g08463 [Spizellomyces sp. 'palustris']|nr:hypothetical protein SpCBS45565_g08463 [Spizellomyces sp. 'palustris']
MAESTPNRDALYFHVLCFVLLVVLLAYSARLHHISNGNIFMKTLLVQNVASLVYYSIRFFITAQNGDSTCGVLTIFSGVGMWYVSLGLYYYIQAQKTRALLQSLFRKVHPSVFIGLQVIVMLIFAVNVIGFSAKTSISDCRVNYDGLLIDFVCAILIQFLLLIQNAVILVSLQQGAATTASKWTAMQLSHVKEATLLMVFLISSNTYIYYIYIPTILYIIWYLQILAVSYVSYSTIENITATKNIPVSERSGGNSPTSFIKHRPDFNANNNDTGNARRPSGAVYGEPKPPARNYTLDSGDDSQV